MAAFTGLSIIIPTVDETKAIAETVEIISKICSPEDITEIIIVHSQNAKKDHVDSLFALKQQCKKYGIQVLCQPGKGLGDALFYGCSISRGSHFFMIGADRENDTYALKKMLELAKLYPDTVITASRTLEKNGLKEYSPIKRGLAAVFNTLVRIFFGSKQTDITYAYQITPKKVFDASFFDSDHSAFVLELALMADIKKLPLMEIPSVIAKRKEGVSHSGVKYYAGFAVAAIKMFIKKKAGRVR